MLEITIPAREMYDERKEEFITIKEQKLRLEHSLVSISKWESKWHKPFLGRDEKTTEENMDYIRCMTLTQNVDDEVYKYLTSENITEITEYIHNPMTATTFSDNGPQKPNREILTAEVIYYYMIQCGIPVEFQKWHLNKLITLIRVCGIKNSPAKKMGKGEIMRQNAALNAARRKQLNTKG